MPRSLKVLIIVGALVAALVPVAAVAGHQFTDVPNSHTFHADISWLADKGITKGCNPPANTMYCPEGPVTRGQMAAFMHRFETRLGTRYAGAFASGIVLPNDTDTRLTTTNMTAPISGGAIAVTGSAGLADRGTRALGLLWAEVDNGGRCNGTNVVTIADGWDTEPTGVDTSVILGAARGVPAGNHRVDLCGWRIGGTADAQVAELGATWIATGATGGSVLSRPEAENDDALSNGFTIGDLKAEFIASANEQ